MNMQGNGSSTNMGMPVRFSWMPVHDMGIFSMDAFWCLCYYSEGDF